MEGQTPWLYYICTVATTAAVVALSVPLATGYTIIVPAIYGVIRLLPAGGAAVPLLAVLDAMYAVILGSVVLIIVTMLRQAAESVDRAQEAALQRYDLAARQHATEIERVKVDALVHDSVLTTLLSAAAAGSPEEEALAARMARDAVKRLDEAGAEGPRALETVGLPVLVRRLRAALTTFSAPFTVRVVDAGGVELPVEAVDALLLRGRAGDGEQHAARRRTGPQHVPRAAHPRHRDRRVRHRGRRQRRRLRSPRRSRRAARASRLHRGAHLERRRLGRDRVSSRARHHRDHRMAGRRRGRRAPMIAVPRWLLLVLGAIFSAYHVVLGIYSLDIPRSPWPAIVALVLYSIATVASLWPVKRVRMPDWLAAFDLAVEHRAATARDEPARSDADNGYATWYVAAVGTLMTIAAARRQLVGAWLGVIALAVQTVVWAGPLALGALGVIGSIVWVAIAHTLTSRPDHRRP